MTMQRAQCGVGIVGRSRSDARPLPGVVSALAGAPAGWQVQPDPRRRGSFLVLVVGTLALLAVITIVYVALGNQDNRTRAATVKRGQLDEVPSKMADYITGVIAEDALAISNERNPDPNPPPGTGRIEDVQLLEYREATDAPGVWYNVFSNPGQSPAAPAPNTILWKRAQFNPVGTVRSDFDPAGGGEALDPALVPVGGPLDLLYNNVPPSDPWLASSEPTFLDFGNNGPTEFERLYLDKRDWFSITNIAPDGSFVNLANLRPEYSGFGATPEEMRGIGLNTTNTVALKTLYDPQTGAPVNAAPWTGAPAVDTDAAQNRPFFWTMYQANAFRPAAIGRNELLADTWEDPAFRLYQWVDADGDGMLDSRIFEMKEAAGVAAGDPVFIDTLSFGGKYRWFFGSRIIDLSGRVNVNTAGDLASQPMRPSGGDIRLTYRVGSTPADVDLLRILRMTDMVSDVTWSGAAWDWSDLVPTYDHAVAFNLGTGAYQALRAAIDRGILPPATDPQDANLFYAFDGALDQPNVASIQDFWEWTGGNPANFAASWLSFYPQYANGSTVPLNTVDFTAQRRAFYREQAGKAFGEYSFGVAAGSPQQLATISRANFTVDDLAELLTRDSINDPRVTTALESVLAARDATDADTIKLSVLRSERSLEEEMGPGRARYDISLEPDTATPAEGSARDLALLQAAYDVRGKLTTISNARLLRSGARVNAGDPTSAATSVDIEGDQAGEPMTGAAVAAGVSGNELTSAELKADLKSLLANTLLPGLRDANSPWPLKQKLAPTAQAEVDAENLREASMRRIFLAYADALAPYSGIVDSWPATPPFTGIPNPELSTLSYGANGPEMGLLTAAHMAANLRDMVDTDDTPTIATISLVGDQAALGANSTVPNAAMVKRYGRGGTGLTAADRAYPSWLDPNDDTRPNPDPDMFRLSIHSERLAPSASSTVAPAINVYGIEPQPFLTQVITMTAYMDDTDGNDPGDGNDYDLKGNIPPNGTPIGDTADNEELLFRMVAFTLTNPFDRDITLSPAWLSDAERDPLRNTVPFFGGQYVPLEHINNLPKNQRLDSAKDYYYIQWGDREYYLGALTHVFYKDGDDYNTDRNDNVPAEQGTQGTYIPANSPDGLDKIIVRPITIKAGQTVVCYASSHSPKAIYDKLVERSNTASGFSQLNTSDQSGFMTNLLKGQIARDYATSNDLDDVKEAVDFLWIGQMENDPASDDLGKLMVAEDQVWDPVPTFPATPEVQKSAGAGQTVNLWRAVRTAEETQATIAVNPGAMWDSRTFSNDPLVRQANIRTNDQLVDRFRITDPNGGSGHEFMHNVQLGSRDVNIDGSDGIVTASGRPYAMTMWARCARRNDRKNALDPTPRDQRLPSDVIPAYCIEPKYRDVTNPNDAWNIGFTPTDTSPTRDLNESLFDEVVDVDGGETLAKKDPDDWIRAMKVPARNTAAPFNYTSTYPDSMLDADDEQDSRWAPKFLARDDDRIDESGGSTDTRNVTADPAVLVADIAYDALYPQINTARRVAEIVTVGTNPPQVVVDLEAWQYDREVQDPSVNLLDRMRVIDALLPLGIGPQETPYLGTSSTFLAVDDPVQFNQRYTTLSEAMSIALGYERAVLAPTFAQSPTTSPDQSLWWSPYTSTALSGANQSGDPAHEFFFDRGNLHTDLFVPFIDANSNLLFDAGDRRVGLSIPAASSVLEQFTVSPDGNAPSLTRGVQGLINMSTASQAVLRSVPFLAPPDIVAATTAASAPLPIADTENWWNGAPPAAPPEISSYPELITAQSPFVTGINGLSSKLDLAAVVDAYRLRINTVSRPWTAADTLAGLPTRSLDPLDDRREFLAEDPTDDTVGFPRGHYADITGLNTLVGLRSVGEVLAIRQRNTEIGNSWDAVDSADWGNPLGFDFFGYDRSPVAGTPAIESSVAALDSYATTPLIQLAPPTIPLQPTVANEYDEKLSIAGAALGTTSVRSDVYAAWFVVMGFQPSDIDACIAASDPLVPSVQRRFLMIVDRSNVTKKGEKPKVLLLKEVPM